MNSVDERRVPDYGRAVVQMRKASEQQKAIDKYGLDAILPGGDPDLDIIDYTLNEVVGLIRYGEMIQHRMRKLEKWLREEHKVSDHVFIPIGTLEDLAHDLQHLGEFYGAQIADARAALIEAGIDLGEPEHR